MSHCGNCRNYNFERMCHTDVCGECFVEGVNGEKGKPSKWKPLPFTNADRIRAMTDEEIARIINRGCFGAGEDGYCLTDEYGEPNCFLCVLTWLKQPAEGE